MKPLTTAIIAAILFCTALAAQDQNQKASIIYVIYRDQAQCDMLARLIPVNASIPCQQMIMVGVKAADDTTTAFRVTLHYQKADSVGQVQSQLVDTNLGGVANAIFLGVDNVTITSVEAEPLALNGQAAKIP